ncbi:hypothetical protein [Dactylosporangium sp. CA-139066]|uniref:hypothetical protein n=1 Tax=Dactylosporangium sp. CA-139066 TaxID=3239930 RepID=UPI003D91A7F7
MSGTPGHADNRRSTFSGRSNYNPRFRTIATNFQAWPGLYTVTDTAPTQVAAVAISSGGTQLGYPHCDPAADVPQLFAVSRPYLRSNDSNRQVTITGTGFGAARGTVSLAGAQGNPSASIVSWTDRSIVINVGNGPNGAVALSIRTAAGRSTINGLTLQLLGPPNAQNNQNNPRLRQVNPPASAVRPGETTYSTVQAAIEAAAGANGTDLVVVWPGPTGTDNPTGAYYENVVLHSSVRLQGVGPGGQYPDGAYVRGSVLDGRNFAIDNPSGTAWLNLVGLVRYAGPEAVPDGAVVTVLAGAGEFNAGNAPTINGFRITGGNQSDFAGNINAITGAVKTPYGAAGAAVTQGGGVYLHANARFTEISDNVIVGNSGSYGGAIRVGTPYVNTNNSDVSISRNQIRDNGGTNLAGGIGIFAGSTNYSVDHNALCGNFSAEYGGAITHFGRSNNGKIDHNQIRLNQSYDEGGGIMVAGELPANPNQPSPGSGPLTIDANVVQANLANDDGGGIRMLQAGTFPITVTNNMVTGNISAHEGGGIALDDAVDVRLIANTVMDNITTATAVTSDGRPAPAGLSTTFNSAPLQATLPANSPNFSKPKMFNNIFWNNRAGAWNGVSVTGIGAPGAPPGEPLNLWDMGSADGTGPLEPTNSVLQTTTGTVLSPTNKVGVDPKVVAQFPTSVQIQTSRTFPSFRQAVIVVQDVAGTQMGNYHLAAGSAATNGGAPVKIVGNVVLIPPRLDIDGDRRNMLFPDIGADEI